MEKNRENNVEEVAKSARPEQVREGFFCLTYFLQVSTLIYM